MLPELLPQFLPQCCDAVRYLLQGETCANSNQCYDQLRPIGAQLWFSMPYRLGIPAESLLVVHWLMLFASIALSVRAMMALTQSTVAHKFSILLFLVSSALVHLVFFWPVMQLALTDAPASLLALIAIWLLITEGKQPKALTLALAGLLLGLSAWIRFAYFYPLLGMLGVYILLWLGNKQRRHMQLLLLTALIPVVIQFAATFLHHGTFGFLGPQASQRLSSEHSRSYVAGWDTLLPRRAYVWPADCERKIGIEQAIHEKNFSTAICLTAYRFYFSFGSYAPVTYISAGTNLLTPTSIEHVGVDDRWHDWHVEGIHSTSGGALIAFSEPHQQDRIITAEKRLPLGVPYTFSVWLWAPKADTIDLILREKSGRDIARQTVAMTSQPTRFFVSGTPDKTRNYGDIEVVIGTTLDHPNTFADRPMAEFYARGAQLEQSAVMTDYQGPDAGVTRTDFRVWSPLILLANSVAMMSVLVLFYISRKSITPLQIVTAIFIVLVASEIIFTQPEQRFVIVVEVYIWLCFMMVCKR